MNVMKNACTIKNIEKVNVLEFENASEIIGSLSNKTRLAILNILSKYGEVCTCDLETALGIPQSTVTAHIRKMYTSGLLKKREDWKFTYYSINAEYSSFIDNILKLARIKLGTARLP
jgi:ArsR family transcriptional regulator